MTSRLIGGGRLMGGRLIGVRLYLKNYMTKNLTAVK